MPGIDEIVLQSAKGSPTVEIIFGHAHVGNYRVFLWDENGQTHTEVAQGTNADNVVDSFGLGHPPAALNKRILSVEGLVQSANGRAGNTYSVTVTVRQDGQVCQGGVIQESGSFADVKALVAFRRFTTA